VLVDLPGLVLDRPSPAEAFSLARRFNRSVYDSLYLGIAEELRCDFWTDDRKLHRALSAEYPWVRWIGDFPEPTAPLGPG
jgi:predicted nucleic acid-binding protein